MTAAAALAMRGWSVRVHERANQIRATGSGIFVAENSIRVLETLGADKIALKDAIRFHFRETRDNRNRVISTLHWPPEVPQRIYVLSRETLVRALQAVCDRVGVELRLGSVVTGASTTGSLRLDSGDEFNADLVVGADGINSTIRQSQDFGGSRRKLSGGAIRAIVPRLASDQDLPAHTFAEYWTGPRRIFYSPISPSETYLALMTVEQDIAGARDPMDVDAWTASFPHLKNVIERIENPLRWTSFEQIKLPTWSQGKIALIGDAAHAMAPNLGQGGGTAMMDGISLAANVSLPKYSLAQALQRWESSERPIVDKIQRLSKIYGTLCSWPERPRGIALQLMGRSKRAYRLRMAAAEFVPDGVCDSNVTDLR
jgi:2-polyprenyl-6-methoxyphenol hydroxylase-like FAD-dependent oxidoreductase